jgi:large subunit ribosomal protein L24
VHRVLNESTLLDENANMAKKPQNPNPALNQAGGIGETHTPIHVSNVALYNPGTGKGDRVSFKSLDDGPKPRIFNSTGEAVDI